MFRQALRKEYFTAHQAPSALPGVAKLCCRAQGDPDLYPVLAECPIGDVVIPGVPVHEVVPMTAFPLSVQQISLLVKQPP